MTGRVLLSRVRDSFLALLVLLILVSNFSTRVYAADTGLHNAGTGANVTGIGTLAWTNPGNITTVNYPWATRSNVDTGHITNYLQGSNYSFAIPSNTTIQGITVVINRASTGGSNHQIRDYEVKLVKGGAIVGTNKAETATDWHYAGESASQSEFRTASYGGNSDLWGTTWTYDEINSFSFGAVLSVTSAADNRTAYVDYMQISVTYTSNLNATTTIVSSSINPSTYNQSVSFTADVTPPEATGTVQFTIDTADFGAPVPLTNSSATSISVTTLSAGSHTVTAVYSGDASYSTSSGTLSGDQNVNKSAATVTLQNLAQTYGGNPKMVTATTVPPGLNVSFTYDGSSIAPSDAGSYTIVGTINDTNYSGGATDTLVVAKADQTITLGTLANKTYGDASFTVSGSATSGLPLSYNIVSGPASVIGNSVTLVGAGSVTIMASQLGDGNYNAALDVSRSFTVAKAAPAFSNLAGPGIVVGTTPTSLGGRLKAGTLAPSGTVSITLNGVTQSATIDGAGYFTSSFSTASLTISGSPYPITYTYGGNSNFLAAQDNSLTLRVTSASASVTLGSLNQAYDGNPKTVTASTNPSGLDVTFTYDGSGTAPTDAGSYTVVGTINDVNYSGAATGTLVVTKAAPAFSNLGGPSISAGTSSTSLGGTLTAGSLIPSGTVSITLNGTAQSATINASGDFASSFNTGSLTTSGSPYTLTYSYGGDTNFEAATDNSQTLTVTITSGGGGGGSAGGGGGGGGGATSEVNIVVISGLNSSSRLDMDPNGKVRKDIELKSDDGKFTLEIRQNTELRDATHKILSILTAARVESPPGKALQGEVVLAYDFGPQGATFNPPITLTLTYDPADFTGNVTEQSLVIAWWDGSNWIDQESVVNTADHSISTEVSHFSLYALIEKLSEPLPSFAPGPVIEISSTPTPSQRLPETTLPALPTPQLINPTDTPSTPLPAGKPLAPPPAQPWSILLLIYIASFAMAVTATILVVLRLRQNQSH